MLYTGSARARELLDDWDNALTQLRQGDAEAITAARCSSCKAERQAAAVAAE